MTGREFTELTRRNVVRGVGGLAALSMSGAAAADVRAAVADSPPADPHTLDTYRAIVDAIVPETPELAAELGPEHAPGGLAVELEQFIVWDFDNFQEVRYEALGPSGGQMSPEQFEVALDTTAAASDFDAVLALTDDGALDAVDDPSGLAALLDFGAVERLEVAFADDPLGSDATPAVFDLRVETADGATERTADSYPYAAVFPLAFDLVAAEFLLRGGNEDAPGTGKQFPGGGTFVRLSREDRLRCLWAIVDGGAVDRLDGLLSPLVVSPGILKFVVMAVNGLHGFGYYTEWSGYGETKTAGPSDRELETPAGEVQSRRQTGYPGPADGYAADWRHAIPGGFRDPPVSALDLPDDLTGDDVVEGGDAP